MNTYSIKYCCYGADCKSVPAKDYISTNLHICTNTPVETLRATSALVSCAAGAVLQTVPGKFASCNVVVLQFK